MKLPTMEERNAELGIVVGSASDASGKAASAVQQTAAKPSLWERGKKLVLRTVEKVERVVLDEYPVTASTALGEFVVAIIWARLQEPVVAGLQAKSAAELSRPAKDGGAQSGSGAKRSAVQGAAAGEARIHVRSEE